MACKFVLLLACAALVGAGRVSRREAPAASPLQDIQKHAEELKKEVIENISKLTNSQTTLDAQKTLKEGADSVLQQLSLLSTSWGDALKDASGKAKEALEAARVSVDQAAADLRKAHPEVEQQASALGSKLQDALTKALEESQKVAKQVQEHAEQTTKELAPKLETAYNNFAKQVQEGQKKLLDGSNKQ